MVCTFLNADRIRSIRTCEGEAEGQVEGKASRVEGRNGNAMGGERSHVAVPEGDGSTDEEDDEDEFPTAA